MNILDHKLFKYLDIIHARYHLTSKAVLSIMHLFFHYTDTFKMNKQFKFIIIHSKENLCKPKITYYIYNIVKGYRGMLKN